MDDSDRLFAHLLCDRIGCRNRAQLPEMRLHGVMYYCRTCHWTYVGKRDLDDALKLLEKRTAEIKAKDAEISRLREVVTSANGKEWYRFWLMRGEEFRIHGHTFNAGETDVLISMYAKPQEVTK